MSKVYSTEFPRLFKQLCEQDCYHVQEVPFVPDVVLDIGANVGVFTTYARFLFPKAQIIAIEPDPRNWALLQRFTSHFPSVIYIKKALGTGPIWYGSVGVIKEPYYGGPQSYVTAGGLGFPEDRLKEPSEVTSDGLPDYRPAPEIAAVSLDTLIGNYVPVDAKSLLKVDCEGGENCIFEHKPSMAALRRMDYITMEIHFKVKGSGPEYDAAKQVTTDALMSLSDTHDCLLDIEHHYFQATRKQSNV